MSDRLAVFNKGRIEQVGAPPRSTSGRDRGSSRASSGRRTCSSATSRERSSAGDGTFTVRPEKIHLARSRTACRGRTTSAPGADPGCRLRRARHALHRRARRGRRARRDPAEPAHVLDRGARRAGPGGPAHLEATALPPHRGWGRARGGGDQRHDDPQDPDDRCHGGVRRRGVQQRKHSPSPAPEPAHRARRGRGSGDQRAGLAGLRRGRLDRPGRRLGDPLREETGCDDHRPDLRDLRRGVHACSRPIRSSSTSSPPRATPAFGSVAGGLRPAGQRRPHPELRRDLRATSRTSRTTRSTASTTASRTAAELEPPDVADRRGHARHRRSWVRDVRPGSPYNGKFSVYDAPIYIADAAVVLMTTKPDLGIENPYALDDTQFAAAVDLLKQQKPAVGEYWARLPKQMDVVPERQHDPRDDLAGHHEPPPGRGSDGAGRGRQAQGGRDGLVRHLDDQLEDQEPELRLRLRQPHDLARDQRPIAEWFGEAPGNSKSCELTADPDHCDIFHAARRVLDRTSGTGRRRWRSASTGGRT